MKTGPVACIALAAAVISAPAAAQSVTDVVVMRRTVAPPSTFTPTWSAWGACSNNKRIRTVTSCTRTRPGSSPVTVENSRCGAQSAEEACVSGVTCEPLVGPGRWTAYQGGKTEYLGYQPSVGDAETRCRLKASTTSAKSLCTWDQSNGNTYWYENPTLSLRYDTPNGWASRCQ